MISMGYGGIDRVYGDITLDAADRILDLVDEYCDILELLEKAEEDEKNVRNTGAENRGHEEPSAGSD